jgi:hypothetical protein
MRIRGDVLPRCHLEVILSAVRNNLLIQGCPPSIEGDRVKVKRMLNMRFEGTDIALMARMATESMTLYRMEVGDEMEGSAVVIDMQTILLVPGANVVLTHKHLYVSLDFVLSWSVV